MRSASGLSSITFVMIVLTLSVVAYAVLPRFVSLDAHTYQAKWAQTKQSVKHIADTLGNKQTYDRIEEMMERSESDRP